MSFKQGLVGLSMVALLSGGAFAQAPAPAETPPAPPAPADKCDCHGPHGHMGMHCEMGKHMELTADQKTRMRALHEQFRSQRKADWTAFKSQVKSILTPAQVAVWNKDEAAREQREAAFRKGEEQARHILQKSGQPVPSEEDQDGFLPHGGFMMMRGPEGGPGGPGGPLMLMRGEHGWHGHDHDKMFKELNLTPTQMGEVHVFREAVEQKEHTEMRTMMEQMRGIVNPGGQPSAQP